MSTLEPKYSALGEDLVQHWPLQKITFFRKVANHVFTAELAGRKVYVRASEKTYRTQDLLTAELNWMHYLAGRGLAVATPILSQQNELLHAVGDYFVSVFEEVKGRPLTREEFFNEAHLRDLGTYIAHMHNLTADYKIPAGAPQRFHWQEEPNFLEAQSAMDSVASPLKNSFVRLIQRCESFGQSSQQYFLIHADLHFGNFFYDNMRGVQAFDFDDACYHHFLYDLAVPLYALMSVAHDEKKTFDLRAATQVLTEAYRETRPCPDFSYDQLNDFIYLRMGLMNFWLLEQIRLNRFTPPAIAWAERKFPWHAELFAARGKDS